MYIFFYLSKFLLRKGVTSPIHDVISFQINNLEQIKGFFSKKGAHDKLTIQIGAQFTWEALF